MILASSPEKEIQVQLEAALKSQTNINEFKSLLQNEGWKKLEEMLRKDISNHCKAIFRAASDPDKNKTELIVHSAMARMCEKIITLVHGVVNKEHLVQAEIIRLTEKQDTSTFSELRGFNEP